MKRNVGLPSKLGRGMTGCKETLLGHPSPLYGRIKRDKPVRLRDNWTRQSVCHRGPVPKLIFTAVCRRSISIEKSIDIAEDPFCLLQDYSVCIRARTRLY
ncbi:hypothetical protein BDV18DRAFT_136567 [Aspergillus unguis]